MPSGCRSPTGRSTDGPPFYRFGDPEESRRALAGAGFDAGSVRTELVTAPWHASTPELLFDAELHAGVRTSAVLRAQPPERLEAIRAAIAGDVRRHADGDGGFTMPVAALVVSARAG
jgi:hypothetical protein